MSVAVLPAIEPTPASDVFAADLDVLCGYRAYYADEFPRIPFGSDCWDLSQVPGRPAYLTRGSLVADWARISQPQMRLAAKELACAKLCPQLKAVRAVAGRRERPLPLGEVYKQLIVLRLWFDWLEEQGVESLDCVRQEHCDAFLIHERERGLSPDSLRAEVNLMRDLGDYRPVLTATYAEGFRPWGRRAASKIVGTTSGRSLNRTPWIPDEVFEPLLAGAFLLVEVADDVLDAWEEAQALQQAPRRSWAGKEAERKVAALLVDYRAAGRSLPLRPAHLRGPQTVSIDDPLYPVNLGLLGKKVGFSLSHGQLSPSLRALLEAAVDELDVAPGGLDTEPREIERLDGARGPWREPFDLTHIHDDVRLLATACFVVIAGLSGMRSSEIFELRSGCVERVDLGDGQLRYRLRSRLVKHRPHGGVAETWTVTEPVVRAVEILERLSPGDEPLLTAALACGRADADRPYLPLRLKRLVEWQNADGALAGLPAVPDVDGRPWPLAPRQFRRTLARQLAFRPHGTIASKVHLKHVSALVTESYWGPPGESASAFLAEVEAEEREARLETIAARYHQWQDGEPLTGGASRKLREDFAVVERELKDFQGTVEQSERRLRLLLRRRADTLHIGLLNDCHFTDPRQARCLRSRGVEDAQAPLINACEPSKCANACITREHLPQWQQPLLQITNLLQDRKIPPHERQRLKAERERLEQIVKPLTEETR